MNLFKRTTATVALVALVSSVFTSGVSAYNVAEFNAAEAIAAKGYINSQSDAAGYNLSGNILRTEIAKVAANVAGLSANSTCENKFADVSATVPNTWACGYVEALLANGLISANANYNPNANLTKAEAVKLMLTVAGEEVSYGADWQADFVAYAVENGFVSNFSDYNTAATRGFVFSVAAAATTEEEGDDILSELDKLLGGDDEETTTEEETEEETTVVSGDSELMVELSPETPSAAYVAADRERTAVLAFDVTAGSEDVTLKELTLEYTGLSDSDDFSKMAVYLGNDKITKGSNKTFSDNESDISFEKDTVIKAGETQTLVVNVEVASSTGNVSHKISLTNLDASTNVELSSVSSVSFGVVDASNVATLDLDITTLTADVTVGEVEKLADFSLEEKYDKENVTLKSLTIEFDDFDAEDDLSDVVLKAEGEVIASNLVVNSDDEVVVNLEYTIPADEKVDFELEGVVTGSIGDNVQATLTEVYAVGSETGLITSLIGDDKSVVLLSDTASRGIEGSEINVSFDKSDIDEAKPNASEVLVGTLKLNSVSDYTVDSIKVTAVSTVNGVEAIIDRIELDGVSSDSETYSTGAIAGDTGVYTFEDISLSADEDRTFDLTFDVVDNVAINSSDVTFTIEIAQVTDDENDEEYKTVSELNSILSTNSLDTKTVDIETATLTLTQTTVTERELVLGNGVEVVVYKSKLSTGDSDDVTIKDFALAGSLLTSTGGAVSYDFEDVLDNVTLNIGGATFDGEINAANVEFNSINAVVAAGSDNVEVLVTARLKDSDSVAQGDEMILDTASVVSEDSEGEDLVVGNVVVTNSTDTTVVLNEKGSLVFDFELNGDLEDSIEDVVLAGSSNVALAELKIEAKDEDMKVKELVITAAAADLTTTLSNVRLMNGSSVMADGAIVTMSGADTIITFENDFVIEDSSDEINALLVADLEIITTEGGMSTAIADDIDLSVTSVETKGVNSNDDITVSTSVSAETVSVVPVIVTIAVADVFNEGDTTSEITFNIDKGNNDLDNDDIVITSINFETGDNAYLSTGAIRNDDGTPMAAVIAGDAINLTADNEIVNGDKFTLTADTTAAVTSARQVVIVKNGVTFSVGGAGTYTSSNDEITDLGSYKD